jgi:vancomycin resistance protein YoaR
VNSVLKKSLLTAGLIIVLVAIYSGIRHFQPRTRDSQETMRTTKSSKSLPVKPQQTATTQAVNLEFTLGDKKFAYKDIPLYQKISNGQKTLSITADGNLAKKIIEQIPTPESLTLPAPSKLKKKAVSSFDKLIRGETGLVIDRDATLKALEQAIKNSPEAETLKIDIATTVSEGKESYRNKRMEMGFNTLIASFSTLHEGHIDDEGRNVNLRVAAEKIDGLIIPPGGKFSFDKVVGPRTEKYGFKKAGVISRGKVIQGLGGGICQVSTTLYRSILQAGLKINERHNHSIYEGIDYAERGLDAAIAWGYKDFKFQNNLDIPVLIAAKSGAGSVTIELYAEAVPYESVRLETRNERKHPFKTKLKKNSRLKKGEKRIVHPGVDGYTVETYRIITNNGKVKEERMSKDRYLTYHRIEEINN